MWLLNASTYQLEEYHGNQKPDYAILSHTWGSEEVSFLDIRDSRQGQLRGWAKIELCCAQAVVDGYEYVWADTCCIDKRSIVELSEALNSMFRWYKEAAICYTYLADIDMSSDESPPDPNGTGLLFSYGEQPSNTFQHSYSHLETLRRRDLIGVPEIESSIGSRIIASRWFTRGWTLQELLAPKFLVFYDVSWVMLGTRLDCLSEIESRTGIPQDALQDFVPEDYCVAQKMAWAAGRQTTRPEDRAYSLLGLLDVSLSLIYGEGEEEAFIRLQRKLLKRLDDTSILAWNRKLSVSYSHWLLAPSPDAFEGCHIFREYKSCAYGVDLNKSAMAGSFDVQPHCFDISFACLGHFKPLLRSDLSAIYRNHFGWTSDRANTVGMLLVKLKNGNHQCAAFDNQQRILYNNDAAHQHHVRTRIDLRISSVSPSPSIHCYYSWLFYGPSYPVKGDEQSEIHICPAQFYGHRRELGTPAYQRGLYGHRSLDIGSQGRELRCFVIHNPKSDITGTVVEFHLSPNERPTLRCMGLKSSISKGVLDTVISSQIIETTGTTIEVASRRAYDEIPKRQASMNATLEWANSSAFDELVAMDYDGGRGGSDQVLPGGSRVIQLGDNIKVVFLPREDGYQAYLSFRGKFRGFYNFPRSWLWPPLVEAEIPAAEARKDDDSLSTKFKRLFRQSS